jgi:hypothetical protein
MQFPKIPGKTPREQFENLTRRVLAVPKEELDKREAAYQKDRARKKRLKRTGR